MIRFSKFFLLIICISLLCTAHATAFNSVQLSLLKSTNRCTGCNLIRADLSGADLSGAVLFEADLSNANLSGANLTNAVLLKADLSNANLSGANLSGANLAGTFLYGAIWTNGYKCTDPTCSNCK